MREHISFNDRELDIISKESGLSKLELVGLIGIMNQFTYSRERIRQYEEDERMGKFI